MWKKKKKKFFPKFHICIYFEYFTYIYFLFYFKNFSKILHQIKMLT